MALLSFGRPFLELVALTIIFIFLYRILRGERKNYPPGPPGIPIFGSLFSLLFTKLQQYETVYAWQMRYGPIIQFKLFNTRLFILGDVGLVKEAFQQSHDMVDRPTFPPADALTGTTNTGIIYSNGTEWKKQRRFFASVFKTLETSVIGFQEIVGKAAETLIGEFEKSGGRDLDPSRLVTTSIANIITTIVTGENYDYDDEEFQKLIEGSNRLLDLMGSGGLVSILPFIAKLPLPDVRRTKEEYKKLLEFIKIAVQRRSTTSNPQSHPTDFTACYLKEKSVSIAEGSWTSLQETNFELTLIDTLIAGLETSSTSLLWILHTLAIHTKDQERVREEIRAVVGRGRRPVYSEHLSMPITEATISECMRYCPAADFHIPHVASRDCKIGGYDVPKGSNITCNLWYLAKSPKLWDKPEEFRPDRFLDARGSGAMKRDLEPIPFGYGRRICPGEQLARMELFLLLTYILQDFTLTLPEDAPRKTPRAQHALTNRPEPFEIQFTRIK